MFCVSLVTLESYRLISDTIEEATGLSWDSPDGDAKDNGWFAGTSLFSFSDTKV